MADQQRVRPVRGKDEPAFDPVRATTVDYRLGGVLVVVDEPIPDKRDAGRSQERADDLGPDVARHLRPWETTTPGQGHRYGRVQMSARDRAARVDRKRDRESPEESRRQQAGQEAVRAAGDGIGDEAIAQEDQDEHSEDLPQILFSPAFFG